MITQLNAREELEKALGKPVRSALWDTLSYFGQVEYLEDPQQHYTLEDLKSAYEELEQIHPIGNGFNVTDGRPPKPTPLSNIDERGQALGEIISHYASSIPAVHQFRAEMLRGELVIPSRWYEWIKKRAADEGVEQKKPGIKFALFDPMDISYFEAYVKRDGQLAALDHAGDQVHETFVPAMNKQEAIRFVLTGRLWLPQAVIDVHFNETYRSLSRIILTVDPRMSVKEVGELYLAYRDRYKDWLGGPSRRMEDRQLRLAVFTALHYEDGKRWRELREEWNKQAPKPWNYPKTRAGESQFSRDAKRAWERVVGASWRQWRNKK